MPPMIMKPVAPEPLPQGEVHRVLADIKDIKKPKAISAGERMKKQLKDKSKGKDKEEQPVPAPEMPASWNPFTNFMAEESAAAQTSSTRERKAITAKGKEKEVAAPSSSAGAAEAGNFSEADTSVQHAAHADQTTTLPTSEGTKADKAEHGKPENSGPSANMFKKGIKVPPVADETATEGASAEATTTETTRDTNTAVAGTEKADSSGKLSSIFKKSNKVTQPTDETAAGGAATETAGPERTGAGAAASLQKSQTAQVHAQSTGNTTKPDGKASAKGNETETTGTDEPTTTTNGKSVIWGSTATGSSPSFKEAEKAQLGGLSLGGATSDVALANAQKPKKPRGSHSGFFKRAPKPTSADETTDFEEVDTAYARGGSTTTASGTSATRQSGGQAGHVAAHSELDAIKISQPTTEKGRGKLSTMFKKGHKSKGKDSGVSTNAAGDLNSVQDNVPQIEIGEGPMSEGAKQQALRRYQAMVESGIGEPVTTSMAGEQFGALDAVVAAPPGRVHSISEDTVLVVKPAAHGQHILSEDAHVTGGRSAEAHALEQDKVINAKSSRRGAHRLSADAMVPVRNAAPGHYLDADPIVSGPQQLVPHELPDDPRVLRPKSPQPHDLELDKKLAVLQKQIQPHSLHSDTVLPAPPARSGHELHADQVVALGSSAQDGHDISHDVRLLSPSGAVRDPHSIDDDEVIKESAVFRKSPHPDAMMGGEGAAPSSSGGEASTIDSRMPSLNASLQTAGHALDDLNRAVASSESGKENTAGDDRPGMSGRTASSPAGRGFWVRVFRREESDRFSEH